MGQGFSSRSRSSIVWLLGAAGKRSEESCQSIYNDRSLEPQHGTKLLIAQAVTGSFHTSADTDWHNSELSGVPTSSTHQVGGRRGGNGIRHSPSARCPRRPASCPSPLSGAAVRGRCPGCPGHTRTAGHPHGSVDSRRSSRQTQPGGPDGGK